jgi:hypothetical protein
MVARPRGVRAGDAAAGRAWAGRLPRPSVCLGAMSTVVGSKPRPRRPDGRIVTVHRRSMNSRWSANSRSAHACTGSGALITAASGSLVTLAFNNSSISSTRAVATRVAAATCAAVR